MKRNDKPVAMNRPASAAPPRPRPAFPANLAPLGAPTARQQSATSQPARPPPPLRAKVGTDSQAVRLAMVCKLQAQGVRHPAVLQALQAVERHRFVDTALGNQAYEDTSLPIGLGQTISKPSVVARMLELLCEGRTGKLGRVLEIGTGCGYQAALLAQLCQEVYSMERLRGLHERARNNLRALRLANVHLLFGDGMLGFSRGAPYAAIIAAAGGDSIPQTWVDQLAVGGRLVAPTVTAAGLQNLFVLDKTHAGVAQQVLEAVHFVPLKSGVA